MNNLGIQCIGLFGQKLKQNNQKFIRVTQYFLSLIVCLNLLVGFYLPAFGCMEMVDFWFENNAENPWK